MTLKYLIKYRNIFIIYFNIFNAQLIIIFNLSIFSRSSIVNDFEKGWYLGCFFWISNEIEGYNENIGDSYFFSSINF